MYRAAVALARLPGRLDDLSGCDG